MAIQLHPNYIEDRSEVLAVLFTEDMHLVASDEMSDVSEFLLYFAQKDIDINIFLAALPKEARKQFRDWLEELERFDRI
jgi:hypothetical protein